MLARRLALREAAQDTGEIPDPMPHEVNAAPAPLTLRDEMRRFITQEISARAHQDHQETFEEADDFEVEEETDLTSQYTVQTLIDPEDRPNDLEGEPTQADKEAAPPAEPAKPKGTPLGQEPAPTEPGTEAPAV